MSQTHYLSFQRSTLSEWLSFLLTDKSEVWKILHKSLTNCWNSRCSLVRIKLWNLWNLVFVISLCWKSCFVILNFKRIFIIFIRLLSHTSQVFPFPHTFNTILQTLTNFLDFTVKKSQSKNRTKLYVQAENSYQERLETLFRCKRRDFFLLQPVAIY